MSGEGVTCPRCAESWPYLSEQAVAVEHMNSCMRCSYFDWSEDQHVSVIEAIQDRFLIDYTKFIKILRKEVRGVTVAVAKDRANPYAESSIAVPKRALLRSSAPAPAPWVSGRGLPSRGKRDRARSARKRMQRHRRRGR